MTASFIAQWLPWLLSAITIASTVLTGNKHRSAWLLSLGGQAGWLVYILAAQAWGFLPLTLTLTVLYWRNHLKWQEDAQADQGDDQDSDFLVGDFPGGGAEWGQVPMVATNPEGMAPLDGHFGLVRNPKPFSFCDTPAKPLEPLAAYIERVKRFDDSLASERAPTCGVLAGEPEVIGVLCKDGGKCHHQCETACFRQQTCSPLTASGLGHDWQPTVPGVEVTESFIPPGAEIDKTMIADLPVFLVNPELVGEMDLGDAMKLGAWVVAPRSEPTITRLVGTVEEEADRLIALAQAERKVVTISLEPQQPLAMRNYCMVADVRDAR